MIRYIKYSLAIISLTSLLFLIFELAVPAFYWVGFQSSQGFHMRDSICKQLTGCTKASMGIVYAEKDGARKELLTLETRINPGNLPDTTALREKAKNIADTEGSWIMKRLSDRIEVKIENHWANQKQGKNRGGSN